MAYVHGEKPQMDTSLPLWIICYHESNIEQVQEYITFRMVNPKTTVVYVITKPWSTYLWYYIF